jgi:hypothetical protein
MCTLKWKKLYVCCSCLIYTFYFIYINVNAGLFSHINKYIIHIHCKLWNYQLYIIFCRLQVILGLGAYGRISKLNIYKEALSDSKMIRAYENYAHLPFDQLVQGWSNIVLSDSVTRIFPSSVGNEDICDIGIKQGCPPGEGKTIICVIDVLKSFEP